MQVPILRWATSGRIAKQGLLAALLVPIALCVALLAYPGGAPEGVRAVVFVAGLIAVATLTSLPAAIACAMAAFLGYRLAAPNVDGATWQAGDLFLLFAFALIAVIVTRRASRTRQEVEAIRLGGRSESARRELAERLAGHASEGDACRAAVEYLESMLGMKVALWLGSRGYVREGRAPQRAGAVPATNGVALGEAGWHWLGLEHHGLEGAVAICPPAGETLPPSIIGLVRHLSVDIANSVLRLRLANDLQKERTANESERLCTSLLASVAHDLRTPLATIMASSETLRCFHQTLSLEDRQSLLENIESEGRRLDEYIQNLVDVTRIGQGQLDMELDCLGADELVGSAITRLRRYHPDAQVDVRVDPDMRALRVHAPLLEQAVFNLLHNAAKFSPEGRPICVTVAQAEAGEVWLDVVDEGPGIPRAERERVFDMFYSAEREGKNRAGTGLGLAISQSIVRAHGGEVRADRPASGRGTMMRIQLPATATAPAAA